MAKEKYEISLWKDELDTEANPQYYKERKIAIIGSDTLTASCRAMEPQLVENINGTNTFTFKMFYTCRDDSLEDLYQQFLVPTLSDPATATFKSKDNVDGRVSEENSVYFLLRSIDFHNNVYTNPFLGLLVNERKIKVLWKNKWYDLVIKNCQEDSDKKSITYTCTDVFINELSKTGYEVELDNELMNNQGTATELAQQILSSTDWTVDTENSDTLLQEQEDAVYECDTLVQFDAFNQTTSSSAIIPSGKTTLIYYTPIQDVIQEAINSSTESSYYEVTSDLQFAYASSYEFDLSNQLVKNADCYLTQDIIYYCTYDSSYVPLSDREPAHKVEKVAFYGNDNKIGEITLQNVSSNYRAERLVNKPKVIYDSLFKKYCNVYELNDNGTIKEVHGFEDVEYREPLTVNNILVNTKNFTSTQGWRNVLARDTSDDNVPTPIDDPTDYLALWHAKNTGSYVTWNNGRVTSLSNDVKDNIDAAAWRLRSLGWSDAAIATLLGVDCWESGLNPWRWQSDRVLSSTDTSGQLSTIHGYGLSQFTPFDVYKNPLKYHSWAQGIQTFLESEEYQNSYGPNFSDQAGKSTDGDAQLQLINFTCVYGRGNYFKRPNTTYTYGYMPYADFKNIRIGDNYVSGDSSATYSTYTVTFEALIYQWLNNFGRGAAENTESTSVRLTGAQLIYEYLQSGTRNATITTTTNQTSTLIFKPYPEYDSSDPSSFFQSKSYLRLPGGINYNEGLKLSSNYLPNGFATGEKYIFRYKAMTESTSGGKVSPSGTYAGISNLISPFICNYNYDESGNIVPDFGISYFIVQSAYLEDGWITIKVTFTNSATRADIYNNRIGFFLGTGAYNLWLEEIQFFPECYGSTDGEDTVLIYPGTIATSIPTTTYSYYDYTEYHNAISVDDVVMIYVGDSPWESPYLTQLYTNFEKIRSISGKQSNRYNLLQSLSETFDCYISYHIDHDSLGRIIYENGHPKKYIRIKKDNKQIASYGFVYGIDLKTIQRTIKSDQIATKMIVLPNSNQFARDGFCTISRSDLNYNKTNFIINFDYYYTNNLLNRQETFEDIHNWYLHFYNTAYDNVSALLPIRKNALSQLQSYLTIYEAATASALDEIEQIRSELVRMANGVEWDDAITAAYIEQNSESNEVFSRLVALASLQQQWNEYSGLCEELGEGISNLRTEINNFMARARYYSQQIQTIVNNFNSKYARFLQEGTWQDENYVDDNQYYLDGLKKSRLASRPQISYNISVLRLSSLEEFKYKIFRLGDLTYIQDTEFFGYTTINNIKTPYREKVQITEITSYFEEPEKDNFKVQNYKTEFDDLFQRITNASQSYMNYAGSYNRATSIVQSNGLISGDVLQASIDANKDLAQNSYNKIVSQDAAGFTVSDTINPNDKIRLTPGGIFVSNDDGNTWQNVINGSGIATSLLKKGVINTNNIGIMDGNKPTFRWDEKGISAYDTINVTRNSSVDSSINLSRFVRFDNYGIYGIDGATTTSTSDYLQDYTPSSETDIKNDAKFGLTWDGFFMKNRYGEGRVEISNENDISIIQQVGADDIEKIRIGRWNESAPGAVPNYKYGIRIKDNEDNVVMRTDDNGNLWVRGNLSGSGITGSGASDQLSFNKSNEEYIEQIGISEFSENYQYYKIKNGQYVEVEEDETFDPNETYYIRNRMFYLDSEGLGVDGDILTGENHFIRAYGKRVQSTFNQALIGDNNNHLTLTGDKMRYQYCGSGGCSLFGPEITFESDSIKMKPYTRSTPITTLHESCIGINTAAPDSSSILDIHALSGHDHIYITQESNNINNWNKPRWDINIPNGTITFTYTDNSSEITHTLNLMTGQILTS